MGSRPHDGVFAPFRDAPATAAVITDFDGTLAPIVADPAAALPYPGTVEVLHALAGRYALVGIVSGRPVEFLASRVGTGLWLCGLYGLEQLRPDGTVEAATTDVEAWRSVVASTVVAARDRFGDRVEDKGLSLTVHFRTEPSLGPAVRAWADDEAARTRLEPRGAKASVELHPPVAVDKGSAISAAVAGLRSVCFLGDDVGDLPAFDALDRLAADGVHAVRVGVSTIEAPPDLLRRADVVVEGPAGVLGVLQSL